ncbi:phosphate signaling complex protein PhoU [Candidatus Kaiserbacteria bacterium]|nr:phosphate signaling complex protein PhoU [Candidatus Kaiserbacteria bacterium]
MIKTTDIQLELAHHHISKQFDQELMDIRNRVLILGGLVEEQVDSAINALIASDVELAERVISDDYKVNSMEVALDEECTQILALRQPAARDLRLVVAVIKTITDLERIGDDAKRIGRITVDMAHHFPKRNQFTELHQLALHARKMLHDSLDAFARIDVDESLRVVHEDKLVDQEYESIARQQITFMMEDPRSIPVALNIMWASRALERIGDRACNICEYVVYYALGKNIRHINIDQVERDLRAG